MGAQLDMDQVVAANTSLLWDMHWKSMHVLHVYATKLPAHPSFGTNPERGYWSPRKVSSIKFVKLEHGKEKRPITCKFYDPRPQQSSHTGMCRQLGWAPTLHDRYPLMAFLGSILCGTVGSFSFPEYILQ